MPAPIDQAAVQALLEPFGQSRTLPAPAYRSQEIFDWEKSTFSPVDGSAWGEPRIYWLPANLRALDHGTETLLLARDSTGVVHGFSNVCRHRGHPLVEVGEPIDARLIRCPTTRGRSLRRKAAIGTLADQSPDFDPTDWPLIPMKVGEWLGWLFLDPSGAAGPLDATFGNLAEFLAPYEPNRLVKVARHAYEIRANWKLVVENYHGVLSLHIDSSRVVPGHST